MMLAAKLFNCKKAERLKTLFNRTSYLFQQHHQAIVRNRSFAAAMTEALEKHVQQEEMKKSEREQSSEQLKEIKAMKRNIKRKKWVDWKTEDETKEDSDIAAKRAAFDPAERVKRKKSAILLGYCGAKYLGMQRNPGVSTIEEELFKAMLKQKWITDDSYEQAQVSCFQRAARTDKGVSAARQVCSVKLPEELNIKALNSDLPEEIRLFGVKRATKGFNAKDQCNARTYTYTTPTIVFTNHTKQHDYEKFRISETELTELRKVLEMFLGTKNFHNFTSKKNFLDPSAKRFIMAFECLPPYVSPQGIEFLTLKVKGQSFMLHQIRKMVGLVIAIIRGNTTSATLERAFTEERLDIPMAPGLGLVLDTVHYDRYNDRYGNDGIHEPLTWVEQEAEIQVFVDKYIYANIYETEAKDKNMLDWLNTLHIHTYDVRRDEKSTENDDTKSDNNSQNKADDEE